MKRELSITAMLVFCICIIAMSNPVKGAPVGPIELKIMIFTPPDLTMNKDVFIPWAKMLEERTGGRVKGVTYPGELLGKLKETYDRTVAGVADIGWAFCNATPGQFPLHMGYELPFMFPNTTVGSRIIWENFEKEAGLRAEFSDVKVLWIHCVTPGQLHTIQKPVRKIDDLRGLKIRVPGGSQAAALKALGATTVGMPTPDVYLALERKTIDGVVIPWEGVKAYRFHEVTKYHTQMGLSFGTCYVIMNKKKWESLSPDIQKIIEGLSGAWGAELTGKAWDKAELNALEMVKGLSGQEIINLSPEEMARWHKTVQPIRDEWVKEMETKGLPGRKIFDQTISLVEKYSK